jgi:hypothetical protein
MCCLLRLEVRDEAAHPAAEYSSGRATASSDSSHRFRFVIPKSDDNAALASGECPKTLELMAS